MVRYILLVGVLALAGGIVGYREFYQAPAKKTEGRSQVGREIPVKLAAVKRGPISYVLNTSGDVVPLMQVEVVSPPWKQGLYGPSIALIHP